MSKKRNSKLIADGLYAIYDDELKAERAARKKQVWDNIVFDEKYMLLADFAQLHPVISDYLLENIDSYKELKYKEAVKDLPSYLSKYDNSYTEIVAKIEQEQDLAKYTLEELASLLRPYSREGWATQI